MSNRQYVVDEGGYDFAYVPIDGCTNLCVALELFGFCTMRHDGREPLTAQELHYQSQMLDIELQPIEAKLILDLSQQFVGFYNKYDEDDQALNPYDPYATDDDDEDDE